MLSYFVELMADKHNIQIKPSAILDEQPLITPILDTPSHIMTVKEYNKKYYDAHKAKRKEKIICDCGRRITREYMKKHKRTKMHILKMEELDKML
jgi:hypothetical protein